MGEHEDRMVERRILAPPPTPRFLGVPAAGMTTEHVATHDRGTDVLRLLLEHSCALVVLATALTMRAPPGSQSNDPLVEGFTTDAERLFHSLVGTGCIAVE